MKKQPEPFLLHMLDSIARIESYVGRIKKAAFIRNAKTQDAVIRQLEIIGEAAGRISFNSVKDSPIPWRAIVGMRNRLIHDYLGVDLAIVWKTVKVELPRLKAYLKTKV
ncbi:MAG: DUF86 domain-containing protein [Pseudomonadota bacterium]